MARDGWSALFASAFKQSKNPMALVDDERRLVDVNSAYVRLLGGRPRSPPIASTDRPSWCAPTAATSASSGRARPRW